MSQTRLNVQINVPININHLNLHPNVSNPDFISFLSQSSKPHPVLKRCIFNKTCVSVLDLLPTLGNARIVSFLALGKSSEEKQRKIFLSISRVTENTDNQLYTVLTLPKTSQNSDDSQEIHFVFTLLILNQIFTTKFKSTGVIIQQMAERKSAAMYIRAFM